MNTAAMDKLCGQLTDKELLSHLNVVTKQLKEKLQSEKYKTGWAQFINSSVGSQRVFALDGLYTEHQIKTMSTLQQELIRKSSVDVELLSKENDQAILQILGTSFMLRLSPYKYEHYIHKKSHREIHFTANELTKMSDYCSRMKDTTHEGVSFKLLVKSFRGSSLFIDGSQTSMKSYTHSTAYSSIVPKPSTVNNKSIVSLRITNNINSVTNTKRQVTPQIEYSETTVKHYGKFVTAEVGQKVTLQLRALYTGKQCSMASTSIKMLLLMGVMVVVTYKDANSVMIYYDRAQTTLRLSPCHFHANTDISTCDTLKLVAGSEEERTVVQMFLKSHLRDTHFGSRLSDQLYTDNNSVISINDTIPEYASKTNDRSDSDSTCDGNAHSHSRQDSCIPQVAIYNADGSVSLISDRQCKYRAGNMGHNQKVDTNHTLHKSCNTTLKRRRDSTSTISHGSSGPDSCVTVYHNANTEILVNKRVRRRTGRKDRYWKHNECRVDQTVELFIRALYGQAAIDDMHAKVRQVVKTTAVEAVIIEKTVHGVTVRVECMTLSFYLTKCLFQDNVELQVDMTYYTDRQLQQMRDSHSDEVNNTYRLLYRVMSESKRRVTQVFNNTSEKYVHHKVNHSAVKHTSKEMKHVVSQVYDEDSDTSSECFICYDSSSDDNSGEHSGSDKESHNCEPNRALPRRSCINTPNKSYQLNTAASVSSASSSNSVIIGECSK